MGCQCQKPEQETSNEINTPNNNSKHDPPKNLYTFHETSQGDPQQSQVIFQSTLMSPNQTTSNYDPYTLSSTIINKDNTNTNANININETIITQVPQITKKLQAPPLETTSTPEEPFCKYIYEQINRIRTDPKSFINNIIQGKNNIKEKKIMRNGQEVTQLIYKSKVSVALNRGIPAFDDAIEFLKNQQPLQPLHYTELLCVPVPDDENDLKDKEYLKTQVATMLSSNEVIKINSYWREIIKDEESAFLLMVVDDTGKKAFKRGDIFHEDYTYIGISSKLINKTFAAYLTFSK